MRDLIPPFKFNLISLIEKGRKYLNKHITGVTISLPFISFPISPKDVEIKVAKEIIIRLADRRVLCSIECCSNCAKSALDSLHEIRSFLVDKQVELRDQTDNPLYLIIEFMLEAIRQFFTFEEKIRPENNETTLLLTNNFAHDREQQYLSAIEMLRQHIYRCLIQVSKIAEIDISKNDRYLRYDEKWQLEAYVEVSSNIEIGRASCRERV